MAHSRIVGEPPVLLSAEEFDSLREVSKGDAQGDIPQIHWNPGLTDSGERRLATGNGQASNTLSK